LKRCLLDLDGVLVDFVRGACSLHSKANPYNEGYAHFYFNEAWGMPAADFWREMGKDFWANLPWMPDGQAIFNIIDERYGAKNTCILTSPCDTEGCFDGKMAWIKKHLPSAYRRKFLVGPVKDFCAQADHVLIDDRDENHDSFIAAGGQAIIVPRPWNHMRGTKSAPEYIETRFWQHDQRANRRNSGLGEGRIYHNTRTPSSGIASSPSQPDAFEERLRSQES
jgi:5'(3')-deoxyribonucleotidase